MTLETVRDIAIIFLALLSMVQVILMIVLLFVVLRLTFYVKKQVGPLMDTAHSTAQTVQSTARTVEATTNMVGDNVVKPVIATASVAVGVRQFFKVLTKRSKKGDKRNE